MAEQPSVNAQSHEEPRKKKAKTTDEPSSSQNAEDAVPCKLDKKHKKSKKDKKSSSDKSEKKKDKEKGKSKSKHKKAKRVDEDSPEADEALTNEQARKGLWHIA